MKMIISFVICFAVVLVFDGNKQSAAQPILTNQGAVFFSEPLTPSGFATSKPLKTATVITNGSKQLSRSVYSSDFKKIVLVHGGARADFGLHKTCFSANLGQSRPLKITTPDGRVLEFRPAFLVYYDSSNGKSVMIGEVTASAMALVSADQVLYRSAFNTIRADIRYDCSKNSLEQNILLRQRPESPSTFGLNPVSTRLEMWTEWFTDSPRLESDKIAMRPGNSNVLLADDSAVDFGTMKIVHGSAFSLASAQQSIPVAKEWHEIEGRKFLIESVDYEAVKVVLTTLPLNAATIPRRSYPERKQLLNSLVGLDLPIQHPDQGLLALEKLTDKALVLDFRIVDSIPLPTGAVGWWPAGGNTTDVLGGNDGLLSNGAGYGAGEVGRSFMFNGTNQCVRIPYATNLIMSNYTVEAWIEPSGQVSDPINQDFIFGQNYGCCQLVARPGSSGVGIVFQYAANPYTFYGIQSTNDIPIGSFTHIAGTWNGTNLCLYINGVLNAQSQPAIGPFDSGCDFFIGGSYKTNGGSCNYVGQFFDGFVDELAFYNRALTASEIASIHSAGGAGKYNPDCVLPATNAIGWWPGDDNNYDLARTNFGTLLNGAGYLSGEVGNGFAFDGTNQCVQIRYSTDLISSNYSVETWVNPSAQVSDPIDQDLIFGQGYGNCQMVVRPGSSGVVVVFQFNSSSGFYEVQSSSEIPIGEYTHVAGTWNGITLSLYINGVLDAQSTPEDVPLDSGCDFYIGGFYAPSAGECSYQGQFFEGVVDDLSFYNRALSGTEISGIYAAGSAGKCKIDSDNDGLTDLQENFLGTNLNNPDTDGDGYLDGDEAFVRHTDPHLYNSPNGLTSGNGLQVFTPLQ